MNGKFILLLMVSINIMVFVFASSCADAGTSCATNIAEDTYLLGLFFDDIDAETGTAVSGLERTESFVNQTKSLTEPQSSGASLTSGLAVFADVILMIVGMISLLTPAPILDLFNAFGFPIYITVALGGFIIVAYIVSIMEFIRGSQF